MTVVEALRRWNRWRVRQRERIAYVTPSWLTLYPFEVLALAVAFLMGAPVLLGFARPESMVFLLPAVAYYAWSTALVLGAATIVWGLRRLQPPTLASGLQLVGGCFGVYALAVIAKAGAERGWAAAAAFIILFVLCAARSLHFRRTTDIQLAVSRRSTR